MKKGISFPKARENALLMYLNGNRKYINVMSSPNNILGIEYLKALKRQKSHIIPITIKRINSDSVKAVEKTEVKLRLNVDTDYGSVMNYFEIFMNRMIMCRHAAEALGLEFKLIINEQIML